MLQRIICIKNVGRFKNCLAAGDVTFRRFTLIFAENGRGKTTLCAILRSLFSNAPALVVGRKTLGAMGQPEIQLLTSSGTVAFRNGIWSAGFPNIAVFDGTYVSENVFAGDVIHTDHRRNLYRVIIGAQGVALAGRVNTLDEEIKVKNNEIRDNRTALQRHLSAGMTVEAFISLAEDAEIDLKITSKEQELQAAQRSAQLQQRPDLRTVPVPLFPPRFAELLAKTLDNIAADSERRVVDHLARHQIQARGETWLSEGLGHTVEDTCPFCGQALAGLDLIAAYRSFFSREYHELREEVRGLSNQVEMAIGERVSATIEQTVLQNANGVEFWGEYCAFTPPEPLASVVEVMASLRDAAQAFIQTKTAAPLEAIAPDERFSVVLANFETLRTAIGNYNGAVSAANVVIIARKREAQIANVREIESLLSRLRAQKARHSAGIREICETDVRLQGEKVALEAGKGTARDQLDRHTEQVIALYGQSINRYLERINAGFRITTPTHTYRGGPPSTSYQILINQSAVDLGDSATPADRPSFRNTLSSGDRSTLALAFFFAQLEQDGNRADKVVVFDDPFTSMDSFRRNHTVHQIYRCGETCAQVVLLSHESTFLKLLWDRIAPADRKTLQLARVGEENTTLTEWDIERAVQARFRADIDTLSRFFSQGQGERMDVIQKLRPVLEGYCRNLYPTQFGEQEMMGGILGIIRTAGAAHPLHPIVEDLDEINVYCRRYHHGENPSAATEQIDDAELQGYVRRSLKVVGGLL